MVQALTTPNSTLARWRPLRGAISARPDGALRIAKMRSKGIAAMGWASWPCVNYPVARYDGVRPSPPWHIGNARWEARYRKNLAKLDAAMDLVIAQIERECAGLAAIGLSPEELDLRDYFEAEDRLRGWGGLIDARSFPVLRMKWPAFA